MIRSASIRRRRSSRTSTALTEGSTRRIPAQAAHDSSLPQGVYSTDPLGKYWEKSVASLTRLKPDASLKQEVVQERHRIFALLLMALVVRFWNGNNNGPIGIYPQRTKQKAEGQDSKAESFRYNVTMATFAQDLPCRLFNGTVMLDTTSPA
jgi:hypothetical protein